VDSSSAHRSARHLTILLALFVPVFLAMTAQPAAAHGDSNRYVTVVTDVQPALAGLTVSASPDGSYLIVTNRSDKTVIVLGYEHEAYLKITRSGVWRNTRSPATYLNADLIGDIPEEVNADAEPEWQRVSSSGSYRFHDHRIDWMGKGRPRAVTQTPNKPHRIKNWTVDLLVDASPVTIRGTLSWSPAGISAWYLAFALVCICGIIAFVFAILIDARRGRTVDPGDAGGVPEAPVRATVRR
jgi:hypothetical protein